MKTGWHFPSNNGGIEDGFNDGNIETYAGARYNGMTREIIQNSLDAASGEKVVVEFEAVKIPREQFPNADDLRTAMQKCLATCEQPKEKAFFENAIKELEGANIMCLKISDSGTTGMGGDYRKRKGRWHAITKARYVSDKRDSTAGGSFGIGKHAPFAVSSLRTVFYSTRYEEGGKRIERAQGKSILKSHSTEGDDDFTSGTGFWGKVDGCWALEGDDIPGILRHSKQGSIVLVAGFQADRQWQHKITATVLANFFYAIEQGKLEVLIQDDKDDIIVIDNSTLADRFDEIKGMEIDKWEVYHSYCYYRAIKETSPGDGYTDSERPHLGHCRMWVLREDDLPKRVALLRKTGMLITDEQKRITRWSGRLDFAGVFLCDSEKGNALLREMENPKHDAFELDRATKANRADCQKALNDLVNWVRECVDDVARPDDGPVDPVEELNELLPDNDSEPKPGEEGEERDIEGLPIYSPKPLKSPKINLGAAEDEEEEEDEGGGAGEDGEGGDGESDDLGDGAGTDSTGDHSVILRPVDIRNVRIVPDAEDANKKKVHFTPLKSGPIVVSLAFAEDDGIVRQESKIQIKGAAEAGAKEDLPSDKHTVTVEAQKGKRLSLNIALGEAVSDSIAVAAHVKIKKEAGNEDSSE